MSRDPRVVNADLHCHSFVSDGMLSPTDLVQRAFGNGVEILSLTDHDEIGGLAQARDAAHALGMQFIPGVEISVTWGGETIHIVGLNIDFDQPGLLAGLRSTRGGRPERAKEMADQLAAVGIPGAFEGALQFVENPELISRTHFARYLVEAGHCKDVAEVFDKYLSEGRPGYVPHRWARLGDAVAWIRGAGGKAVVAHPGRYNLNDTGMWALLSEFREAGGEGIEVITGVHTSAQYAVYGRYAQQFGFLASRGSDFHGPNESHVELGRLPNLPDSLVPVWQEWVRD